MIEINCRLLILGNFNIPEFPLNYSSSSAHNFNRNVKNLIEMMEACNLICYNKICNTFGITLDLVIGVQKEISK